MSELRSTDPTTAVELYLSHRETEVADATLENLKLHLNHFLEWCEREGIDDTTELTGRELHRFRLWRQEGIAQTTLSINLSSVRTFLKWAETIDAVPEGLHDAVILPSRDPDAESRDTMLGADQAEQMLQYLRKFEYATRTHALLELLWHTGVRQGSARALDVADFHPRKQTLELRHRPETETPLKNKQRGERTLALSDEVTTVLGDYIDVHRIETVDDHGREPLFTTRYGRLSGSGIKSACYRMTRPCLYDGCPHGRDPEECDARDDDRGNECPSSVSAHPIRRGSITHHLLNDVPETAVSDRCNVSKDVLDKHYDERTELEKAEQRRKHLDNL